MVTFDPSATVKAARACSVPMVGTVKHSFFGLVQPKNECFEPGDKVRAINPAQSLVYRMVGCNATASEVREEGECVMK